MDLNLKNREWKEFVIDELFNVEKGIYLPLKKISKGNTPYITAKSTDNGITNFIGNQNLFSGNAITIEKIKLTAFYQPYDFYCSHDVTVITHRKLNNYNSKFVCQIINRNGVKYNYGRQAQMGVVKREKIFLPINPNNEPDFEFMEAFIKNKEAKLLKKYNNYLENIKNKNINRGGVIPLSEKEWGEFEIKGIFDISTTSSGIDRNKLINKSGTTPYITRTDKNNGYDSFVCKQDQKYETNNSNVITIGLDTQTVFYQPKDFYTGQNIQILQNSSLNKNIAQFLVPLIKRQMKKFSWGGNGATLTRLHRTKILLPIDEQGKPDYAYMEAYIKQLEHEKLQVYLSKRINQ